MLTIVALVGAILLCILMYQLSEHFWYDDMIEIVSGVIGVLIGIGIFGVLLYCFISRTDFPGTQAAFVTRYQTIQYKVDHIDEYNTQEVKELVDEWNKDLLTQHYTQESLWTNWFNVKNLDEVDYIKFDE